MPLVSLLTNSQSNLSYIQHFAQFEQKSVTLVSHAQFDIL